MKYCSHCGEAVQHRIPEGDDRLRYICTECNFIHYQNPRVIVGTLPVHDQQVLLCRRAIEPRKGFWTLPAGFMENGESTQQGALRETWEEARARVDNPELYRLFDLPHINQLYVFYRGDLVNGEFDVGPESTEVALFDEADIPWQELAFPVVNKVLEEFYDDRKTVDFPVRSSTIERLIPRP